MTIHNWKLDFPPLLQPIDFFNWKNQFSSRYLSDRLFELLDRVMSQLGEQSHPYREQYQNLPQLTSFIYVFVPEVKEMPKDLVPLN